MDEDFKLQILNSNTIEEIDDIFDYIFDLVHDARDSGKMDRVNAMLAFSADPQNADIINEEVLLSMLRLTFSMKHGLGTEWNDLLRSTSLQIDMRGLNHGLLWGFSEKE